MLRLGLEIIPADPARTQKALHRLLPAAGWALPSQDRLHGSSNGSSNGSSVRSDGSTDQGWLPTPSQQAGVAEMLLQQVGELNLSRVSDPQHGI